MTTPPNRNSYTLSAIILNYNYAHFVGDAIESVLAQTPPFDEVVVVDDGSTDTSLKVIESYLPRVRVVAKENGGQLSACLAGAATATSDYVYILDADDYAAADFVVKAKAAFEGWPAKVQFQLFGVDAQRKLLGSRFPTYPQGYGSEQMIHDNRIVGFYLCPPTSGNIFRRDVLLSMPTDRISLREFVDGPPALAVPYLGPVKSVNEALAYYRVHGKGHSSWDKPDASLLQFEIDWFYRRWADVGKLLDLEKPPFGESQPLYVLERLLMLAGLLPGSGVFVPMVRYLRRLFAANLLFKQKLMLTGWALALLLPQRGWRKKLILARRSPVNRSPGLKRLIGALTRDHNTKPVVELPRETSPRYGHGQ